MNRIDAALPLIRFIQQVGLIVFRGLIVVSIFVAGEATQVIIAQGSVSEAALEEWLSSPAGDLAMFIQYESQCHPHLVHEQQGKEGPIIKPLMTHEECAKKANAQDLYLVLKKAHESVAVAFPLNQI